MKKDQSKFKSKTPEANVEVQVLKNQLARTLADYDNLTKRIEKEREDYKKIVSLSLILKLLSVLDNLEAAQKHLNDQGLQIAITEFKKVLDEEGLVEINPKKGEMFDPLLHEVVESIEGGKHGEIAETLSPGWKFKDPPSLGEAGGNVVRVAKVKVFQKTS